MQKELDYRAIVESMVDMILVTDAQGQIQYASPQWELFLGYTPDELIGHLRVEFMSEEEGMKLMSQLNGYYAKQLPFYMVVHKMKHKLGHEVLVESSGVPYFGDHGDFLGYRMSHRDITNRQDPMLEVETEKYHSYKKLLRYQEVISNATKLFMNAKFDQMRDRIRKSMCEVGQLLDVDRVYIFEFDQELVKMSNTFEWCNEGIESAIDILQDLDSEIFPWWMKKLKVDEVINIYDVTQMLKEQIKEKDILMEQGIKSVLVVPMMINQVLIGFIGFDSVKKPKRFQDEIQLLRMYSEIVSFALVKQLDEQRIFSALEHLKRTFHQTIEAFSSIIEISNPYTSGHQSRVGELAVAIGRLLHLDESRLESLRLASLLHDLGKFYVPLQILNKPGKLSEIELNMIKSHPSLGYEVLKKIDFPWPVADIVLQHHERIDGTGYPYGLSGDEIMLESKILCVANVMESLSTQRPHRPALGVDFALQEIREHRGKYYDESAVDACILLIETGAFQF